MQPEALMAALQHAGVSQDHIKAYFRAELGFSILVQALNKGVEASETQVREELAKEGGKAAGTAYTVQQIIFTLPQRRQRPRSSTPGRMRPNSCARASSIARPAFRSPAR